MPWSTRVAMLHLSFALSSRVSKHHECLLYVIAHVNEHAYHCVLFFAPAIIAMGLGSACTWVQYGSPNLNEVAGKPPSTCVVPTEKYAVRCCSDEAVSGFSRGTCNSGSTDVDVWTNADGTSRCAWACGGRVQQLFSIDPVCQTVLVLC